MSFELVACVTARERTFRESAALEQKAVFRNLRLDRGASTPHKLATVEGAASLLQARCRMARYCAILRVWRDATVEIKLQAACETAARADSQICGLVEQR